MEGCKKFLRKKPLSKKERTSVKNDLKCGRKLADALTIVSLKRRMK